MYYRRNCCNTVNPVDFPALGMLIREHQLLEDRLQSYGQAISKRDVAGIRDFATFMLEIFMPLHFGKEEQVSFLLYSRHLSIYDETVAALIHDHEQDRLKFFQLVEMIDRGDDFANIKEVAGELCDSIGEHMEEETGVIFPKIEAILTPEEVLLAVSRMTRIGCLH